MEISLERNHERFFADYKDGRGYGKSENSTKGTALEKEVGKPFFEDANYSLSKMVLIS